MIYQEDWATVWFNASNDDEIFEIAKTYITAWASMSNDEVLRYENTKKYPEYRELLGRTMHDGNRALSNLRSYIEDKNKSLVWSTINQLIYYYQVLYTLKKVLK
jgi:hypothetical protein